MRRLGPVLLAALLLAGFSVSAQEVRYRVELTGIDDRDLRKVVEDGSLLLSLADEAPASVAALRRRAETDEGRVREVLRAEGYYAGSVDIKLDEAVEPAAVSVEVMPGPAFTLEGFDVRLDTVGPRPDPVPLERLGLRLGQRARARGVLDAQAMLLKALAEQGFPLAKVEDRRVVVDHGSRTMRVELLVSSGPLARFGPVSLGGLDRVGAEWVRNRIPWREGDRFDVDLMETLRKRLVASGLFSSVKLSTASEVVDGGLLPLAIELAERDRRSIGLGASWSSTEGLGADTFWEHRNLFGGAERLRLSLTAATVRNAAEASFRAPDLGRPDQDLVTAARVEEQRTEAFATRTAGAQAGLEWLLSDIWQASAGGAVERTFEEEALRTRAFTLVSLPLSARRDSSDDLLDPTGGNRLVLGAAPFLEALGSTIGFTRLEVYDSQYLQVLDRPRVVLAGWARLGTIQGAKAVDIPADKRFYVGGAGSVRAYGLQRAGPVDEAGDPVGGRSALAFGGELRIRLTDIIGLVPFVEAGSAYRTPWPDLDQRLFWGVGLGLRYHTPIGPVRTDVGIPLDRRPGIDDTYQITLSLGQAF